MTRDELKRLLTQALRARAITDAQAAAILRAYDAGTLDPSALPADIQDGLDAGTKTAIAIAALILLDRARLAPTVWTYSPETRRFTAPGPVLLGPLVGGARPSGGLIPAGPITPPEVRRIVDHVIDAAQGEMMGAAEALAGSRISLADWFGRMEDMIAERHIAAAAAARGGMAQITEADRLWIRDRILEQYGFLDGFADDILAGRQPLDGRYRARVELYNQAARGTFEDMRRRVARDAGITEERRILGTADHCETIPGLRGCPELASLKWQPLGTLPRIGETPCRTRCRCSFRFRKAINVAA